MASLLTLPALALSNPSSRSALPHAAAFRCCALRRRGWGVVAAVASPNSVLTEHAFKRLRLGGDDGDEYGREAGAGLFEGDADELSVARLGLPDELVATLEKRGVTHLFPIQVKSIAPHFCGWFC
jgi:ATP-dependent RNA helicase DDX21